MTSILVSQILLLIQVFSCMKIKFICNSKLHSILCSKVKRYPEELNKPQVPLASEVNISFWPLSHNLDDSGWFGFTSHYIFELYHGNNCQPDKFSFKRTGKRQLMMKSTWAEIKKVKQQFICQKIQLWWRSLILKLKSKWVLVGTL